MNILNKKVGYTLMEVLIVVVVIGILATMGMPFYRNHLERQRAAIAITNLRMISDSVERYMSLHANVVPTNFALLDLELDPSHMTQNNNQWIYSEGYFDYYITNRNGRATVSAERSNYELDGSGGELWYILSIDLDDTSKISCTSDHEHPDYCENTLHICND